MFPEPIIIFGIPIRLFGIVAALSLICGYLLYLKENKRLNISLKIGPNVALAVLLPSFIAARLLFIIVNWQIYAADPMMILRFWEGGLVLFGGILGGLFGGYLYCLKTKQSFSRLCDPVALAIALGLPLSRLGCFIVGCCYGRPTDLPWGITFHNVYALAKPLHTPLHPAQLYAFFIGIIIFLSLFIYRKRKTFNGEILLLYLIMISLMRMGLEWVRADSNLISFIITFVVLVTSGVLYYRHKFKRRSYSMNKSTIGLVILVIAVALSSACVIATTPSTTRGFDIKQSEVSKIVKGQTTEQEIIGMFGNPSKYRNTAQGKEFFYEYAKAGGDVYVLNIATSGGTVQKTLLVFFNKKGVVTNYVYKKS